MRDFCEKKKCIGTRIKKLREENHLTQSKLEKSIGIHNTKLSKIENGQVILDINELYTFADYFGVSVNYILCEDQNETSQKATTPAEVGRLIRSKRQLKNFKLFDVCRKLKGVIDPIRLTKIEDGEITPTREEIYAIAEVLEFDVDTLLIDDIKHSKRLKQILMDYGLSEEHISVVEEYVKFQLFGK